MKTEELNQALIEEMKLKVPSGVNLAGLLMDTLFLGKEAVYRRLRGEVPFTLGEAATISQKLGVSVDRLIGGVYKGNALFDLDLVHYSDPVETYYTIMNNYVDVLMQMKNAPDSELYTSSNIVPHALYLKYEHLSRFRLFKWSYRNEKIESNKNFRDMIMPDKVLKKQREFVDGLRHFKRSCYVWDNLIFTYLVNDIRYFIDSQLIEPEDIQRLKEELLQLLDELENIASRGRFATGNEVEIYISNINFEATYSYVRAGKSFYSLIRVFAINSIVSQDIEVFENMRDWIQSLKKFSILISESGEMQRILYFKKQREIVNTL